MNLRRYLLILLQTLFFANYAAAQTDAATTGNETPAVVTEPAGAAPSPAATSTDDKVKSNSNLSSLNYNVFLETKDLRFNVGIFFQFSSFEREGLSLVGNPYEVLAGYALTEKLGFNINLMQALDLAAGASVLYTGVRTSASYNLFGKNFSQRSIVMINGEPSVSIAPYYEPTFSVDLGFEQLFFNGESRVAPGTGMSVGALYTRTISTYRLAVMARYGQLTVGDDPVSLMTVGAGLIYRF